VNTLDLLSHYDTMINLRMSCVIISVIYNIVSFAVPSQFENLAMKPGSHTVIVNWKK